MRKIVTVTITALFPQLKGGKAHQQGRGQGSSVAVAFAKAGKNLFKQPGLRNQRYSEFTASFTVGTVMEETEKETKPQ